MFASYDEYEAVLASGAVDAVYIALPNTMHREYTVKAARHGVQVIVCDRPNPIGGRAIEGAILEPGWEQLADYVEGWIAKQAN